LDLVDQRVLQLLFAQDIENVVRVDRTVHQWFAGSHPLAFLYVDVHTPGHRVLTGLRALRHHRDLPRPFADTPITNHAVDFGNARRVLRLASLEELDHARQAA